MGNLTTVTQLVERHPELANTMDDDEDDDDIDDVHVVTLRSPLHEAATYDHVHVVEYLLDRGAKIDVKTASPTFPDTGSSPLMLAIEHRSNKVVDMLLERGANPIVSDRVRSSPLVCASFIGNLDGLLSLLRYDLVLGTIDYPVPTWESMTALHFSCYGGHANITRLLLDAGADPTLVSGYGTPLDISKRKGRRDRSGCTAVLEVSASFCLFQTTLSRQGHSPRGFHLTSYVWW